MRAVAGRGMSKRMREMDGCLRKIRYGHKKTATDACAAMRKRGSTWLTPYHCDVCGGWHIGHRDGWLVVRIERAGGVNA